VIRLLVAVYVDVDGEHAGNFGADERRNGDVERRAVEVEELGFVHGGRSRLVVGRFPGDGADVDDDADQRHQPCTQHRHQQRPSVHLLRYNLTGVERHAVHCRCVASINYSIRLGCVSKMDQSPYLFTVSRK